MKNALVSQRLCPPGGEGAHFGVFTKYEMKLITGGPGVIMGDLDDVLHNDPLPEKNGQEP